MKFHKNNKIVKYNAHCLFLPLETHKEKNVEQQKCIDGADRGLEITSTRRHLRGQKDNSEL